MLNLPIIDAERIWIFQCNPNKYAIQKALIDKEVINCFHWKVKQHKNEIANGHIGLIWCSGNSAGIIAITKLISNPGEFNESEAEKKYWIDDRDERGKQIRVKMRLLSFIDNPIKKKIIKVTDGLQDLSILKMPRGTNFPVTPQEWTIIQSLLDI